MAIKGAMWKLKQIYCYVHITTFHLGWEKNDVAIWEGWFVATKPLHSLFFFLTYRVHVTNSILRQM